MACLQTGFETPQKFMWRTATTTAAESFLRRVTDRSSLRIHGPFDEYASAHWPLLFEALFKEATGVSLASALSSQAVLGRGDAGSLLRRILAQGSTAAPSD